MSKVKATANKHSHMRIAYQRREADRATKSTSLPKISNLIKKLRKRNDASAPSYNAPNGSFPVRAHETRAPRRSQVETGIKPDPQSSSSRSHSSARSRSHSISRSGSRSRATKERREKSEYPSTRISPRVRSKPRESSEQRDEAPQKESFLLPLWEFGDAPPPPPPPKSHERNSKTVPQKHLDQSFPDGTDKSVQQWTDFSKEDNDDSGHTRTSVQSTPIDILKDLDHLTPILEDNKFSIAYQERQNSTPQRNEVVYEMNETPLPKKGRRGPSHRRIKPRTLTETDIMDDRDATSSTPKEELTPDQLKQEDSSRNRRIKQKTLTRADITTDNRAEMSSTRKGERTSDQLNQEDYSQHRRLKPKTLTRADIMDNRDAACSTRKGRHTSDQMKPEDYTQQDVQIPAHPEDPPPYVQEKTAESDSYTSTQNQESGHSRTSEDSVHSSHYRERRTPRQGSPEDNPPCVEETTEEENDSHTDNPEQESGHSTTIEASAHSHHHRERRTTGEQKDETIKVTMDDIEKVVCILEFGNIPHVFPPRPPAGSTRRSRSLVFEEIEMQFIDRIVRMCTERENVQEIDDPRDPWESPSEAAERDSSTPYALMDLDEPEQEQRAPDPQVVIAVISEKSEDEELVEHFEDQPRVEDDTSVRSHDAEELDDEKNRDPSPCMSALSDAEDEEPAEDWNAHDDDDYMYEPSLDSNQSSWMVQSVDAKERSDTSLMDLIPSLRLDVIGASDEERLERDPSPCHYGETEEEETLETFPFSNHEVSWTLDEDPNLDVEESRFRYETNRDVEESRFRRRASIRREMALEAVGEIPVSQDAEEEEARDYRDDLRCRSEETVDDVLSEDESDDDSSGDSSDYELYDEEDSDNEYDSESANYTKTAETKTNVVALVLKSAVVTPETQKYIVPSTSSASSDSWANDNFQNLHPIARMRLQTHAKRAEECYYYY
jgi:hypothetical protein